MNFRQLLESKITVYHGDNFGTKALDPKLMNNGNNQEGIGIYFGSEISIAQTYGNDIISLDISLPKFIDSRAPLSKISNGAIFKLLKLLHKTNTEVLYYDLTDWGIEIQEPSDIKDYHIKELVKLLKDEQIRNFQVDYADKFGVEAFVAAWNKHVELDGTYQRQTKTKTWYAVINDKLQVSKVK